MGEGLAGGLGVFAVPVLGSWLSHKCCQAYHGGFVEPLARDPQPALLALVESPPRSPHPETALWRRHRVVNGPPRSAWNGRADGVIIGGGGCSALGAVHDVGNPHITVDRRSSSTGWSRSAAPAFATSDAARPTSRPWEAGPGVTGAVHQWASSALAPAAGVADNQP
jgi:hypothetical protein